MKLGQRLLDKGKVMAEAHKNHNKVHTKPAIECTQKLK